MSIDKTKEQIVNEEKDKLLQYASESDTGFDKTGDDSGNGKNDGPIKIAAFTQNMQNPYPTPFLNLSDFSIPESKTEIFKWCKYYYTFDPLISGAISALSTFPVTEVHLENTEQNSVDKETYKAYEKVLFKTLNIYKLLIEIGIDYWLYGNCFVFGEFKNIENGKGKSPNAEWKSVTRLDPSKMIIDYNPTTGEKKYKWTVPNSIRKIVNSGKPVEEFNKIPQIIKDAVKNKKAVLFNPENIYHFSRASDSMDDGGVWGVPVVANVLKLLMYRNVLRQAQEAIAREHIVPQRIYYMEPQKDANPYTDFTKAAMDLAAEIKKSVRDPNHKIVSPVPVNCLTIGGQGRALMLTSEIEQIQGEILAGMNVPREFIFGGVSYSSSSVSLKILENQFITYRLLLVDFLQNFIIRGMAKVRGEWLDERDNSKLPTVKLSDLKMQDDVQQKQLMIQLNGAGKCSNAYLWKTMGIDPEKMEKQIEIEAIKAAKLQNKIQLEQSKAQLEQMDIQFQIQKKQLEMQIELQKLQSVLGAGGNPEQGGGNPEQTGGNPEQSGQEQSQGQQPQEQPEQSPEQAEQGIDKDIQTVALHMIKLPENERQAFLNKLPEQYRAQVMSVVNDLMNTSQQQEAQSQIDMREMPTKLPPRRKSLG